MVPVLYNLGYGILNNGISEYPAINVLYLIMRLLKFEQLINLLGNPRSNQKRDDLIKLCRLFRLLSHKVHRIT